MNEITMNASAGMSFQEVFEAFVISKTAQGVSEVTLNNYHYHMKNISRFLDLEQHFDQITKKDIERMATAMRKKGIKHNSIATYMRMLRTFYNWCREENYDWRHHFGLQRNNIQDQREQQERQS